MIVATDGAEGAIDVADMGLVEHRAPFGGIKTSRDFTAFGHVAIPDGTSAQ
ncbi:MAG TPA: hypothetical protein VMU69_13365 [Bradyrhizobium sp.]|nr:hypothetical protein [Bradyrhizobium sp.]